MTYYVGLKHGETLSHDSMVDVLWDIQDIYVNENTGIEIWEDQTPPRDAIIWFPQGARRIRGPVK